VTAMRMKVRGMQFVRAALIQSPGDPTEIQTTLIAQNIWSGLDFID